MRTPRISAPMRERIDDPSYLQPILFCLVLRPHKPRAGQDTATTTPATTLAADMPKRGDHMLPERAKACLRDAWRS